MAQAPVQPKKPAGGAFGQFTNEKRKEFMEQCKGKPISEVSKLAGAEWKKQTEEQKAPYQQKFEAAKKKYDEDMAAFLANGGVKQKGMLALRSEKRKAKEAKGAKNAAKDPNAPKRPAGGAYGCYMAKHREALTKECAGKSVTAVAQLAGQRWKEVTTSEKEVYEKEYAAKKKEYEKAMESYVPPPQPEVEEAVEPPAKKAKTDKAAEKAEKASQKADTKAAKADAKDVKATAKATGKPKAKAKGKVEEEVVDIPKTVLAKAEKADMVENLTKLLRRDDIKNAGISASKALDVLSENNGLLHPARRALLGA